MSGHFTDHQENFNIENIGENARDIMLALKISTMSGSLRHGDAPIRNPEIFPKHIMQLFRQLQ